MLYRPTDLDTYDDIREANRIEVFHAEWCGAATLQVPEIEKLADVIDTQILLLNIDDFKNLANIYKVLSVPTMMVMKDDELVERIIGYQPLPILLQKMDKAFAS